MHSPHKIETPEKSSADFIAEAEAVSARNYHPLPVVIARGEGVWLFDADGKKYLDCLAAYSAVNQGHCHPRIIAALQAQSRTLTLSSRAFHNDRMGPFLKLLCEYAGYERALPMNTGTEAVETALKLARKWGYQSRGIPDGKAEIITAAGNFHGRTITVVGFSTEAQYRDGFGPFTPGFVSVPFGDIEALRGAITPNTAALLLEPIQGENGIIIPPAGYLKAAAELCKARGVLLILDEIQTGFGRTGRTFCADHDGVKGDLLIVGKALGGGVYPVSAVLASAAVMSVIHPGDHGSTFGGNPLAAAVGEAALGVLIDERLAERAGEQGDYFMAKLRALNSPHIREIRGRGLMIGIEIKKESGKARPYCETLMRRGMLCKETHDQVIRLAPPLIIDREQIDWAVEQLAAVLA
jgi:ornithine--oxo-acid transaminase